MSTTGNYSWPKRKKPTAVVEKPKRRYLRWVVGSVVILLGGLGIAWATGVFDPDPRLAELRNLRAQMADDSLTDAQRQALRDQLRQKFDGLPEDLRASLDKGRQRNWDPSREIKRLNEFFALSPADRDAALKKEVEDMYRQQQEREKRQQDRAAADAAAKTGDSSSGGDKSKGGQGNGQGGSRGPRGTATDEQRLARSKNYVEKAPPEARAARAVYQDLLAQKAQQMGMPLKMGRAIPGR